MASRRIACAGLLVFCSVLASAGGAADKAARGVPAVADTMKFVPTQKDVEFETPKAAEFAKCKVEKEIKGKARGWVVIGPSGQVLRKFLDTDGDDKYDQWRYYNLGIEVYRDIDSNQNEKADQCRWLNRGGSRWGIDKNEDGHIEQWKVLSAAEASREAIRAMVTLDMTGLQAVMVTAEDLKSLGVNAQLGARLLESAGDAEKKAKAVMKNSKVISPQSVWSRFDAQLPSIIPIDDEKAKDDLRIYESAYAIIESPKKDGTKKSDAVQIGEMIQVGEVWKLTQVPLPIEGEAMTTSPILMEPVMASNVESNSAAPSPKVQAILKELQEIEQKVSAPSQTAAQVKTLMAKRSALLKEVFDLTESPEDKMAIVKQNVDGLFLMSQIGTYPDGVKELKAIEVDLEKKSPDSPLLPYTIYRRMQSEYSSDLQANAANKKKQAEIQKTWLQSLEEFVSKFPRAADADEVMMNLGNQEELQDQSKEAIAWYEKILKEMPKSEQSARAQGALRRLKLNGQPLQLDGPLLSGGNLSLKDLKGKVVLVVFWNHEYQACEEDIPQLRALYAANKAKGFEIVGVALESDKEFAQTYVKKNEMNWPQVFQPSEQNQYGGIYSPIAINFGIISFPTMFLVNKDGTVLNRNANITDIKTELPNLLTPKKN